MGSHDNPHRNRPSMTRVVGYHFDSVDDLECQTDDLLERELRDPETTVTQYGTNGHFLWLNGQPGARLRAVVAKVVALGWQRKSMENVQP